MWLSGPNVHNQCFHGAGVAGELPGCFPLVSQECWEPWLLVAFDFTTACLCCWTPYQWEPLSWMNSQVFICLCITCSEVRVLSWKQVLCHGSAARSCGTECASCLYQDSHGGGSFQVGRGTKLENSSWRTFDIRNSFNVTHRWLHDFCLFRFP